MNSFVSTNIANNIHFYTTLFVCYLRGISTVTLYTSDRSGSYYFEYFQRVIDLFSGDLLGVIDELVNRYDRTLKDRDIVHYTMYRGHSMLYPDNLDEERAHPNAGRRWLQDRFIKIREYPSLKRYIETIYRNCRDNSSPSLSRFSSALLSTCLLTHSLAYSLTYLISPV